MLSQADLCNPLRYLLLLIQASPHPLLIAFRNPAENLLDSVKYHTHIREQKSHIREQARYAGRFPVRPHPSAQP